MHLSLAKQDAFTANVNFKIFPAKQDPLSCISLRNQQSFVQKSVHYITFHLISFHIKKYFASFELRICVQTLRQDGKLGYKSCIFSFYAPVYILIFQFDNSQ
jgi:hypothetical protein